MADPTHEIPYTIGDQERQVRIEDGITALTKMLEDPLPRCAVNMEKITSLETSRKRFRYASGSIGIGFVLYTIKVFFNKLIGV